ncbi:hypothetical protein IWQ56_004696, partial [Coemansia nantahalensis]
MSGARAAVTLRAFAAAAATRRGSTLTHVDATGDVHMVDVSDKQPTLRTARARGRVLMNQETFDLIRQDGIKKGNVLAVAQIAGIQGAKSCSQLIPLCHPIAITKVSVDLALATSSSSSSSSSSSDGALTHAVEIESLVRCKGETGVEME